MFMNEDGNTLSFFITRLWYEKTYADIPFSCWTSVKCSNKAHALSAK
jgi:hypothetical protein